MTERSRGGDPLWAVALGILLFLALTAGGVTAAVYFAKTGFAKRTSPEAVDTALTADPDSAAMIEAMQESYPEDYAKIRIAVSESARRGAAPASLHVETFQLMRNAALAHLPELAQAPHAELAAYTAAESRMLAALETDDLTLCARYIMRGFGPGEVLSPEARIALAEMGVAQWRGAAAGRDQPVKRKVGAALAPRDAEALVAAMRKQGMDDRDLEVFSTPGLWVRAAPAQQCAVGKWLIDAIGTLPAEQSDRVAAWLILQKRLK
ncbi:hypothetical protein FHS95_002678 [Sphingomonas naasensis]|uniref:Uncharacterized protein n=1 Tax=Sphingomonas naasensis TaxID=1344951 RepID=A0A4S1WN99_9SPHN|nr:hypothetical protein [Sphingomonas naasensis]NIJ20986.1 hypothetical protein [Sphingomonas naasensis]TGX43370.1 hypothetical protein E5A74_09415 [Sphingomonas naasensis]